MELGGQKRELSCPTIQCQLQTRYKVLCIVHGVASQTGLSHLHFASPAEEGYYLRPSRRKEELLLALQQPRQRETVTTWPMKSHNISNFLFLPMDSLLIPALPPSLSLLSKNDFETARWHSARGKVIAKKWFIRLGHLWCLQVGRREDAVPWELSGLQFYYQRKSGEGEKTLSFLTSYFHYQLLLLVEKGSFSVPVWSS